jgi:hypothetical protein
MHRNPLFAVVFCILAISSQTSQAIEVRIGSVSVNPVCQISITGAVQFTRKLPATAVTLDMLAPNGTSQRLVTNQLLGRNGAFAWSSSPDTPLVIPQGASLKATTNRQVSTTVPVPACNVQDFVTATLTPVANSQCRQAWTDGKGEYGDPATGDSRQACPQTVSLSTFSAYNAAGQYCKKQAYSWASFQASSDVYADASLAIKCENPPKAGIFSANFNSVVSASMSNYSLWSDLRKTSNANDFVSVANKAGYPLAYADMPAPSVPSRKVLPQSACGYQGQPPCSVSACSREMYIPFFSWFSENATVCVEHHDISQCTGDAMPTPFGYCASKVVSVKDAVSAGCRSSSTVVSIANSALAAQLGSSTSTALSTWKANNQNRSGWITRLDVTDPETLVYRATDRPAEATTFQQGLLISKAEAALRKLKGDQTPEWFWDRNGPALSLPGQRDNVALSLQMLATSSSDEPRSQFLSVALDFNTARAFGEVVYAFRLNPRSPILGMNNCMLSGGGEIQMQVPGNAPIHDLRKYSDGNWYALVNGRWVETANGKCSMTADGSCN